jgi:hypothetical protein
MQSIFNGAGYLLADNSASDWGTKEEDDLLGCGHCHAVIRKHAHTDPVTKRRIPGWLDEGGHCYVCNQPLCGPQNNNCRDRAQRHGCEAYARVLERAIEDNYRREQNAKILGI